MGFIILGQCTACQERHRSVLLWEETIWVRLLLGGLNKSSLSVSSAKSCQQEAMARGVQLDVAYHTTRNQHCCGDTALGGLFWVVQAEQDAVMYGAVRTPSSLGLRCLTRQHLPPNLCGKHPAHPTVPRPDQAAPCAGLLHFHTSTTAMAAVLWWGQKSQHP